jgi:hypothetical protein
MAARKSTKSPAARAKALYEALDSLSRLFGNVKVSFEDGEIVVVAPYYGTRTYSVDADDGTLLVTEDVGTPKRRKIETRRTFIEEPIALLLELSSPNDAFKDAYSDVSEYAERTLR